MIRFILLTSLFLTSLFSKDISLYFEKDRVKNGHTALLYLKSSKNIKEPKLTFYKMNINFLKHHKKNLFYALIPVNYYTPIAKHRVIISYKLNNEKKFKGIDLFVEKGKYKSEVIRVGKSKVNPNKKVNPRIKQEYDEAMNIYNSKSKKLFLDKKFIYPLNTKITSPFGTKRVYNDTIRSFHSGTDFRAKVGTKIYASADGIVKIAKDRFFAGKSVVLDHGDGVYSGYYHLSKIYKKVNQFVKKGEVVGLSGATGRVTGPHLHFTIRVKNTLVEPLDFIKNINKLNSRE